MPKDGMRGESTKRRGNYEYKGVSPNKRRTLPGQAPRYNNYAVYGTQLARIYRENLPVLQGWGKSTALMESWTGQAGGDSEVFGPRAVCDPVVCHKNEYYSKLLIRTRVSNTFWSFMK